MICSPNTGSVDSTSELDRFEVPTMQVKSVLVVIFQGKNETSLALNSTALPILTLSNAGEVYHQKNFRKSITSIISKLEKTEMKNLVHNICKQVLLAYHKTLTSIDARNTSWWQLGRKVAAEEKRILGRCVSRYKVHQ